MRGKLLYSYEINNNLLEMLNQSWNGSAWENVRKYSNQYDLQDNKTSYLIQDWNGNGWVNWTQTLYTYDTNNNMVEEVHKDWNGSQWVNNFREIYTYDAENKLIEYVVDYPDGSNWYSVTKYVYSYDGNNITEELRLSWDPISIIWRNYWRNTFVYDVENNLVEMTRQNWDVYQSVWVNDFRDILEYTPTGINQLTDDINSYSLSDNYPNPFNPATTIRYQVPKRSGVTLKIFSLTGKEVKTLINREQEVGEYEIEFNAGNLPSGDYFYQLRTGNFTQTKKMVLLK